MLEEGALVLERAAKASRPATGRKALLDAAKALRDETRPVGARLAPVESPEVVATLATQPSLAPPSAKRAAPAVGRP